MSDRKKPKVKKPASPKKFECSEVTIKELKSKPKYKLIEGRSTMNKEELCKAMSKPIKKSPKKSEEKKVARKPRKTSTEEKKERKPRKTTTEEKEKKVVRKPRKTTVEEKERKPRKTFTEEKKERKTTKSKKPSLKGTNKTSGSSGSPLKKSPVYFTTPLSPIKSPKNTDLTIDDIHDIIKLKMANKASNNIRSPLKKSPEHFPISPLKLSPKSPKDTDLTIADIQGILMEKAGEAVKSKYMKPIRTPAKKAIIDHSRRNIKGAEKVKGKKVNDMPYRKSPSTIKEEDNYISVTVTYNDESKTFYAFPGDFWGQIIAQLPEKWGEGRLVNTTLVNEYKIDEMDTLPYNSVTARFIPQSEESKGWFW